MKCQNYGPRLGHAKKDREKADHSDTTDLDLCRHAIEYTYNRKYKDVAEITLHFITIKELKFAYRHNGNKTSLGVGSYL